MEYANKETLEIEVRDDRIVVVRLARPDKRNAFNATVVDEILEAFKEIAGDPEVRAVLLCGKGKSFSAGADISWMREQGNADLETNVRSARTMARMFHMIWSCPKPVVAKVHGAAIGGGTGLVSVADVAIAAEDALFGFSEVRLGIVPAVVSPYVVEKIGSARARTLFLLGRRFNGREAERLGLVYQAVPSGELDDAVEAVLADIRLGGPRALSEAKALTHSLSGVPPEDQVERTAGLIARLRSGTEAKEGLSAFLERRTPNWAE